ncbi:MAG: cation:dicarboxylase symporter family transporter [Bacteroidota bacterium]|jgi:proton glutamate symport protein
MFSKKSLLFGFCISLSLVIILLLADHYASLNLPEGLLIPLRWLPVLVLFFYVLKQKSLTTWVFLAMLAGMEFGHDLPSIATDLDVLSLIFLRLIKTIIAPLLFGTLVVGIAGHADLKQTGRLGWKSILYFEIVTTIALFIGLAAINISRAGVGLKLPESANMNELAAPAHQGWKDIVLHIFPENIAKSIAGAEILQIVVFSILFGIAMVMVAEKYRMPMLTFARALSEVMFKFTGIIMYFAPVAVFASIAYTVGHMGIGVIISLLQLLGTLYIALLAFMVFVLLPVCLLFRIPLRGFIRAITEPAAIAFATTSSEAALPLAMQKMEEFGVPRKIVSFVLPLGYTFNLDGTTLYLSLASVFVAQASGIDMPLGTQILMLLTLMLTSKGVAGVSRASLIILLGTVSSFGLSTLPVFLILGVDALMDMGRTATNVIGNSLASAVIAKWEGEFDPDKAKQPQPVTGIN